MQRSDFYYELPEERIAQRPLEERPASRLLLLDGATGALEDSRMAAFTEQLHAGDLLVLNDTHVIPARLHGHKPTGGRVEVLVERLLDDDRVTAHVRASKSPAEGMVLSLAEGAVAARVDAREGELFVLALSGCGGGTEQDALALLQRHGQVPLPPYIRRAPDPEDSARYQTVFSRVPGAVAAPTAGLHFTESMLETLREKGVEIANITLHVGAGTFQPVRSDRVEDHPMHAEYLEVSPALCAAVQRTRERGGRVVAVGTTVMRALESAAADGDLRPFTGDTRLFIYPGYTFHVVDALLTNFHLPESTLLMLVCAFAGYAQVMAAYRHAVVEEYRFFSYGDAMFLTPTPEARGAL